MRVLDRRTSEARTYRDTTADLTAHVGGNPTATQRALIERAAMLTVHLARMDKRAMDAVAMSDADSRCYLAWVNTISRTLRTLGLQGVASPIETLDDIRARHAAA